MVMIPLTESRLREAMRDKRYWQSNHAERPAYTAWVTEGWRALVESQAGDGVVHVQAYERRGPDGAVVQVQAHQRGAPGRAWETQPNAEWRTRIAEAERSVQDAGNFGYSARASAPNTALGRYQVNRITLQEAGWKDDRGRWTPRAQAVGIRTDEDFLANPAAQEQAFTDVLASYEGQLRSFGLLSRAGTRIAGMDGNQIQVTEAGLVAATHREGIGTVVRYFRARDANLPRPEPIPGARGPLARFNQVEARLRGFATVPYRRVSE